MVHKGRSQRVGLLAVNEVDLVKRADNRENLLKERNSLLEKENRTEKEGARLAVINKEVNKISTDLSSLVARLHERIIAAERDMQIILKSESLKPLIVITNRHLIHYPFPTEGDYDDYGLFQSLDGLYQLKYKEYDPDEPIPNYSRWKVRYETDSRYDTRHYWLDTKVEPIPTMEDIFNPEYSIKGIKGVWSNKFKIRDKKGISRIKIEKIDVRMILKEALDLEKKFQKRIRSGDLPQIIPRTKDDAIKINLIVTKISDFLQAKRERDPVYDPSINYLVANDRVTKRLERYMEEEKNKMIRAYTKAEPHLIEAQKIYKKYGLKIHYSQQSLNDY